MPVRSLKLERKLRWDDVARAIGQGKEWSTAACLGQMALSQEEARRLVEQLDLPAEVIALLQTPPYRGSLPTAVPTGPLTYRFYFSGLPLPQSDAPLACLTRKRADMISAAS